VTATAHAVGGRLRLDIQALRGLAILLVLAHHARVPFVPGGFLGVDIFFVVSGFLMARIIDDGLGNGSFTFAGFYARRARRLLPAAYATLVVTAAFAVFLLDSKELKDFAAQLAGAFAFVVNVVLWRQADYFSSGAELKPLLHMWSLAVEEQYYLGLPLLLAFAPRRFRLSLVTMATVASFAGCLWLRSFAPSAAFYMVPSRAWELGVGSVLALALARGRVKPGRWPAARMLAVAILLIVPLVADDANHPGWAALVCCLATALLLVPGGEPGKRLSAMLAPICATGDRSYSLYLVHWPVFAFAGNVMIAPVPLWVNLLLIIPCLVWAEAQYRWVERRLRSFRMGATSLAVLLAIPLVTVGLVYAATLRSGAAVGDRAPNFGLSAACNGNGSTLEDRACRSGPAPETLVWGDSFGMHVAPGVAAVTPGGIVQATKTFCGPFVGVAAVNEKLYPRRQGKACLRFNRSVVAMLARHPELSTVILSSSIGQYLPDAEPGFALLVDRGNGAPVVLPRSEEALLHALDETVAAIRGMRRKVVFLAPPPSTATDYGRCALRRTEGRWTLGANAECSFAEAEYRSEKRAVLHFLEAAERGHDIGVVRMDRWFCPGGRCQSYRDGVILYADHAHLSARGSVMAARDGGWASAIAVQAR